MSSISCGHSRPVTVLALCCGAWLGCDDDSLGPSLSIAEVAGEYELTEVEGHFLPANVLGRLTVFSGHLTLGLDLRYERAEHNEICAAGSCDEAQDTVFGTWLLLHDGSLYLDSREGYSFPPSFLIADGRTVVSCPEGNPTGCAPSRLYERR
jgi:hypothetical protein